MLQGIMTQCCFPQLSYLSAAVKELIKIDFIAFLPAEVSYKILCYLDTTSLCKAAQVSRTWRMMADDDEVWHKMCEQHVNKKCKKCGWGLPTLERERLMDYKRQQRRRAAAIARNERSPDLTPVPDELGGTAMSKSSSLKGSGKRDAASLSTDGSSTALAGPSKRQCTNGVSNELVNTPAPAKTVPWKHVYKDRYKVSTNWKYGRYATKIFTGHQNGVMCLQFSDNILATGSYDCTIKIWEIDTGKCINTLKGHTSGVRALQFDSGKLISGSLDKTLKVWDWRTGECYNTIRGHTQGVISLHFEGNTVVSGSIDKTVRIWNFQDKTHHTLTGHTDWVNCVKLDAASRTVFSASDDLTVRMWDLDTCQVLRIFEGHVGQVQQVTLLPSDFEEPEADEDNEDEASTTLSQADDSDSPQPSAEYDIFAHWPSDRPRPPRNIITGSLDSTIRLWSVDTGRCVKKFFGHVEGVWALAGDNLRFASGAEDRTVKVWDARTGKCDKSITGHAGPVTCLGLSDCRIATGSEDGTARILSFKSEEIDAQSSPEIS